MRVEKRCELLFQHREAGGREPPQVHRHRLRARELTLLAGRRHPPKAAVHRAHVLHLDEPRDQSVGAGRRHRPGCEYGMTGAPRLHAARWHATSPRQVVEALFHVVDGQRAPDHARDVLSQGSAQLLANDEHGAREAGAQGVVDRVVEQGLARRTDGAQLLRAAEAAPDSRREDDERGRAQVLAYSTTRRTPSATASDGRQPQVRCATAPSRQLRATSPGRSGAYVGWRVYPAAAATARNNSRSDTSRPHPTLATTPDGPAAARTVASTTSPT